MNIYIYISTSTFKLCKHNLQTVITRTHLLDGFSNTSFARCLHQNLPPVITRSFLTGAENWSSSPVGPCFQCVSNCRFCDKKRPIYILHISSDIFIWPFKDLVNPTW